MPWIGYLALVVAVAAGLPMLWSGGRWLLMRRLGNAAPGMPMAVPTPAVPADAARLHALAVGFDGRQYTFGGYRYDRLEDAVAYAELLRSRSRLGAAGATPASGPAQR